MKCPHCGRTIKIRALMAEAGSKGGKASLRTMTKEARIERAKNAVTAREKKRSENPN